MSWKVLITARTLNEVGGAAVDLMRRSDCELVFPEKFGPHRADVLAPLLAGMDACLASMDQFNATVLGGTTAAQLKIISRWGVGYDAIDVPRATKLGIVVGYTPGLLNETVADYAFALLLGVARRIHEGHLTMRQGLWQPAWGHDVHGKTLGILGCGRIGQAMARRASGFNMRLVGYDITPSSQALECGIEFLPLEEFLAQSDFVSLHAASTPLNRGLIGEAQLRLMKKNAYLINTARGALIDEDALARALREGWIAGAALDAFTIEPMAADHPFRTTPNLLIAPHQASFARETGEAVSLAAAQAIVDLKAGRKPRWVVDPDVYQSPQLRAKLG